MILTINTARQNGRQLAVSLEKKDGQTVLEYAEEAIFSQSEKLLPLISRLLRDSQVEISDITKIEVNDSGEGFTGLRIGVATANALAYALDIQVTPLGVENGKGPVSPKYNREPNINLKTSFA